jgi:hypothetical protein
MADGLRWLGGVLPGQQSVFCDFVDANSDRHRFYTLDAGHLGTLNEYRVTLSDPNSWEHPTQTMSVSLPSGLQIGLPSLAQQATFDRQWVATPNWTASENTLWSNTNSSRGPSFSLTNDVGTTPGPRPVSFVPIYSTPNNPLFVVVNLAGSPAAVLPGLTLTLYNRYSGAVMGSIPLRPAGTSAGEVGSVQLCVDGTFILVAVEDRLWGPSNSTQTTLFQVDKFNPQLAATRTWPNVGGLTLVCRFDGAAMYSDTDVFLFHIDD